MLLIQPQYLTLQKLCDRRLFTIPDYQRAYSWESHQRRDMFGDIGKTFSKGDEAGHFMAAVVCLRRRQQTLGTDEFQVMEVVDGQQRLTTLIILLNAIRRSLNPKDKAEKKLALELADLLVKTEGDELLLLQTNHDSSHHFTNYLRKGLVPESKTAKTLADREILKAIHECIEFTAEWNDTHGSLLSLATLLKNRLFFLLHEVNDEQTVYTVFEVLNSRGLPVSWFDRLKSMLMGAAFELTKTNSKQVIDDLHTIWRDIYSTVGLRQGMSTEALKYAATLRTDAAPRRPLDEEDAVGLLRSQSTSAKTIRETANWLLKVTQACDKVVANPRINAVTRISQARLLATAIFLRDDLKEDDRESLLKRWEQVSFRIYGMLGYDARTRVGDFVRLAWRVVNEKPKANEIHKAIHEIGLDFPIEHAIRALQESNCYDDWENELRYLLYRYEEYLVRMQKQNFSNEQWEKIWLASATDSIEHIWANSKAPNKHRNRLGNLVLLPPKLNSKLQDLPATDKADSYQKTGLLIAGEVAETIVNEGWTKVQISQREERILEWAAVEWTDEDVPI